MKKIGFLISGSGSTLQSFIDAKKEGLFGADIAVVISSKPDVFGLERAAKADIPSAVVEYKKYQSDIEAYSQEITRILQSYGCEFVVMGGFMSFYQVPEVYENKVFNVHPALIPAFCGKGMYGGKVHQAVIKYGAKVSGCTVHLVNNKYDNGPIIHQEIVAVLDGDTPDSLAEKVQAAERSVYFKSVNRFINGELILDGRRVIQKS